VSFFAAICVDLIAMSTMVGLAFPVSDAPGSSGLTLSGRHRA
jgi:hypothetical protein